MTAIRRIEGHPEPILSVCIPTLDYGNGRAERLIQSVREHTKVPWEAVVADCEGALLGYTFPMNCAMDAARGDLLLAANDDVVLSEGWLEALVAPMIFTKVWCVTPDASHTDGPQVFHPWCMLWRKEEWHRVGHLDTQFVLWGSDIDLAKRLVDMCHPPVKAKMPHPIHHDLNATCVEHPELGPICQEDLQRFQAKWGVSAEEMKHQLAGLV